MRLLNKVAIVTGAAGGIGSATVKKFLNEGAKVVIADISYDNATKLTDELCASGYSKQVVAAKVNVANYAEVVDLVKVAVEQFGALDIMFNNAGIGRGIPLLEHNPEQDYDPIISVNQTGVYYGILAAAKQFVSQQRPGVIINTSSIYSTSAADLAFTYCATKAAVNSFTRSAAYELSKYEIRVVGVSPGRVRTDILKQFSEEQNLIFASEQMRGRLTEPSEIADVVVFLASLEANAINGTVVNVEDGYLAFKNRINPI